MTLWSIVLPDASELEFDAELITGYGMPPVENVLTPYGLADGALYQRTTVKPRVIMFKLGLAQTSYVAMRDLRAKLIEAVNHHRGLLPVAILYHGTDADLKLNAYYDSGLDGQGWNGFSEEIPLRFVAPDPYWYEVTDETDTLAVYQELASVSNIARRNANGQWSDLDGGVDAAVYALAQASDGNLYVGGAFLHVGSAATEAAHIAYWDGDAWHTMGAGINGTVYALVFGPDGRLYAGGVFTTAGGGAAANVAVWNGSSWAALGAGVNNAVYALAFGPDGYLYAGGAFTTAGGDAAAHVAVWNGSSWAALGDGLDDAVRSLAFGPDGRLYAGGDFEYSGAVRVGYIAAWDGSSWTALGAGADGTVYALAVGPDGMLYAAGGFGTIGGDPLSGVGAVESCIARWNGVIWQGLGGSVETTGYALAVAEDGTVYLGGALAAVAPIAACGGGWAQWSGGQWLPTEHAVGQVVHAFAFDGDAMVVAGVYESAGKIAGATMITNAGSARAFPVFELTGGGRLYSLVNYTTKQVLHFDLILLDGEKLTIDLRPGVKTITSSFRGKLLRSIIAGNLVNWWLAPGNNYVSCFIDNVAAAATYTFTPRHWSIDRVPTT